MSKLSLATRIRWAMADVVEKFGIMLEFLSDRIRGGGR